MFNTPNSFFAYCALTGHVRAFTRGVGISERTSEPRQHRRWPALLAHVERLRDTQECTATSPSFDNMIRWVR